MADYWLVMVPEYVYAKMSGEGVYLCPLGVCRRIAKLIKDDDTIIAYVTAKGCSKLCGKIAGAFRVVGSWARTEGGYVIRVEKIAEGAADFSSLLHVFSKLGARSASHLRLYSVYYSRKPLPPEVGRQMVEALQNPPSINAAVISVIEDIGKSMGFEVRRLGNAEAVYVHRGRAVLLWVVVADADPVKVLAEDLAKVKSLTEKYRPLFSVVAVASDSAYGIVENALQLMSTPERRIIAVRADVLVDIASILQHSEAAKVVKLLCQLIGSW